MISGGNFHGEPIALALDFAKLALAELGSISERRTALLVDPHLNGGLPAFLASSSRPRQRLMLLQYTAAALVSENKVLAHPASADSIPTSANQEDHVSMGPIAGRQARDRSSSTSSGSSRSSSCARLGRSTCGLPSSVPARGAGCRAWPAAHARDPRGRPAVGRRSRARAGPRGR